MEARKLSALSKPSESEPVTPLHGLIRQESISSSSSDLEIPPIESHAEKMRKIHEEVTNILEKTQKTKEQLKIVRQEVENTCGEIRINSEEVKSEHEGVRTQSHELDLSNISKVSDDVWIEIKALEQQVRVLREKVKSGEESVKDRKRQGDEIRKLIEELEGVNCSKDQSKSCGCNRCEMF